MKLKTAKKEAKKFIRNFNLIVVNTINRTFITKPIPNFLCTRFYAFIIVAENHPEIEKLIEEGKQKINKNK